MSFGQYGVDLATVEVKDYSGLPVGSFPMVIESYEEKKSDDGTSRIYFMAAMTVFEGASKDQKHNEFFDVVNTGNPIVAEIGIESIKKLAIACGKPNAASFEELINIPFVSIRKLDKTKKYVNTVAYEQYVAGAPLAQPTEQAAAPSWAAKA
tara:strand:- start:468 stop:923 length:456 start_codon:yes stop_codon:yes gene_type:complete